MGIWFATVRQVGLHPWSVTEDKWQVTAIDGEVNCKYLVMSGPWVHCFEQKPGFDYIQSPVKSEYLYSSIY